MLPPNFRKFIVPIIITPILFPFCSEKNLSTQLLESLNSNIIKIWYPLTIDTAYGGFLSNFSFDWKPMKMQNKMVVTQTRHLWTLANAAIFLNNNKLLEHAIHGAKFITTKMWDNKYGGFFDLVDRTGIPLYSQTSPPKTAYGNSFAIYGFTALYKATKDQTYLDWAIKTFRWLDKHAYDNVYGGYFQALTRQGKPIPQNVVSSELKDKLKIWKDYNSSIHLLESFSSLYAVWKDSLLRKKLEEMFYIVRDTIVDKRGFLLLHFARDWTHISLKSQPVQIFRKNIYVDHVSFGHDVETAYLLLEAEKTLYGKFSEKTLKISKKLVDHAIKYGWDKQKGGFYDAAYYFNTEPEVVNKAKIWWTQAEGLNSLLLFYKLYPNNKSYYELFKKQWDYIDNYLIDQKYGGWYAEGLDTDSPQVSKPKAWTWKGNYHNVRALINCIKYLENNHELLKR